MKSFENINAIPQTNHGEDRENIVSKVALGFSGLLFAAGIVLGFSAETQSAPIREGLHTMSLCALTLSSLLLIPGFLAVESYARSLATPASSEH